ncbi:MAG: recombination protein NinB [Gammaproteobacteria bacterium]|nr:recombination protein NinB [Gammaproteobacteria bacterium]
MKTFIIRSPEIKENCLTFISELPYSPAVYKVEIQPYVPNRSLEQNDKWHAVCGEIAKLTGNTQRAVEDFIKEEMGYYTEELIFGKVRKVLESSAKWNKQKMSDAISYAESLRAEYGG